MAQAIGYHPPEGFIFSKTERWPSWVRRFENYPLPVVFLHRCVPKLPCSNTAVFQHWHHCVRCSVPTLFVPTLTLLCASNSCHHVILIGIPLYFDTSLRHHCHHVIFVANSVATVVWFYWFIFLYPTLYVSLNGVCTLIHPMYSDTLPCI